MLQIGQMSFQAARTYLADAVPRGSLAALAVAGAAATLQRLVLPVVHWADSQPPMECVATMDTLAASDAVRRFMLKLMAAEP